MRRVNSRYRSLANTIWCRPKTPTCGSRQHSRGAPDGRMESVDQIKSRVEAVLLSAPLQVLRNDSPSAQHSLVVDSEHALAIAKFLRDDSQLRLDYCSNVTGVDWLDAEISEKVKVKKLVDGVEKEVDEVKKTKRPGYLEVVYHLYSMALKHGPVILRQRTQNRIDQTHVTSLTPVWRGC